MKVLHVISALDEKYGGPSILLPELCLRQRENIDIVHVVTTTLTNESISFKEKLLNGGVYIKIFKAFSKYRFSMNLYLWYLKNNKK